MKGERDWLMEALEADTEGLCDGIVLEDAVTVGAAKVLERFKIMFGYWRLQAFWYDGRDWDESVDGPPAVEHECDVYCEEYGCLERKRGKNS